MPTVAPDTRPLRIATFGGVSAFPVRVADRIGAFARAGLVVNHTVTRDSDGLRDGLLEGHLQVVHAAPDNYVGWSDRTGVRFAAWIGGSNGPISLVARDTRTVAGLRGRRIAVDSPTGGFAPIVRRLLVGAGLAEDEVELVPAGATRFRYEQLRDGGVDATMLTLPWSVRAVSEGAHELADHRSVAPGLQTSCAGSLASWLQSEPVAADAYLAAIVEALAWLRDPERRTEATALLAEDLEVDGATAAAIMATMLEPATGWPPTGRVDPAGIAAACELRAETLGAPVGDPVAYVDLGPHDRVVQAELPS